MTLEEKIKAYPTTIISRVVGWMTPITSWNKGKKAEWSDRKEYKLKDER